jgi:hypothetical protein
MKLRIYFGDQIEEFCPPTAIELTETCTVFVSFRSRNANFTADYLASQATSELKQNQQVDCNVPMEIACFRVTHLEKILHDTNLAELLPNDLHSRGPWPYSITGITRHFKALLGGKVAYQR